MPHTQVRRTYANKSNELVERRELMLYRRRNGLLKNNSQKTTSLYRSSCFGPQHKTLAACCPVARDCVYAVNSTDRINVRNTDATDTVQTDGLMFSSVVTGGANGGNCPPQPAPKCGKRAPNCNIKGENLKKNSGEGVVPPPQTHHTPSPGRFDPHAFGVTACPSPVNSGDATEASQQQRASHQTVHSLFLASDRCLRDYALVVAHC